MKSEKPKNYSHSPWFPGSRGLFALSIDPMRLLGDSNRGSSPHGSINFVERALRAPFCLLGIVGLVVLMTGTLWGRIAFEANEKRSRIGKKSIENQHAPWI
ncbi:MAG: hypothetical protein ACFFAS_07670 [Promethearchaeota archaeon]